MKHTATIVVPVYADWPSLNDCLKALKLHVDNSHKIILINDCGPQADQLEKKIQKTISDRANFEYHRNSRNIGFLRTCNRAAAELDQTDNDILLLNSDTKVTPGFLEEMITVLYSSKKIATVTPRTNNATLATIPLSAARQKGIEPEKSYEIYMRIKDKLPRYNEVPTGHGFCMLIKRAAIKKFGLFDEIFGKGYGEENDFCMRIEKHGRKNVLANRAFVFHLEARSFTLDKKNQMLEHNLKVMYSRWPDYRDRVRRYMQEAQKREAVAEKAAGIRYAIVGDRAPSGSRLRRLARRFSRIRN